MFVQVHSVEFELRRQAQRSGGVHREHHDHGHREGGQRDDRAAEGLSDQHLRAAAVEEALERRAVVRRKRPSGAELPGSEQPEGNSPPDSAEAVNRNCADRIIDSQIFEEVNAQDDQNTGDAAEENGARRS